MSAGLRMFRFEVPLLGAFEHAGASRTKTDNIIVEVELGGVRGYGEGVPRAYVTGETVESAWAALASLPAGALDVVADSFDESLVRIERVLELFPDSTDVVHNAARSALELALLDAVSRVFGSALVEPLARAAGHERAPAQPNLCYSLVLGRALASDERALGAVRDEWAFRQAKLKVGFGLDEDLAHLARVRRVLGEDVHLRVDANRALSPASARELMARAAAFGVRTIEDPVQGDDPRALAELRGDGVEVVLDEGVRTLEELQRFSRAGALDTLNIRVSKCGGLLRAARIAAACRVAEVAVQLGCQVGESAILSAAGRLFACAVGDARFLEGSNERFKFAPEHMLAADLTYGRHGVAQPLAGPGLGIAVEIARLEGRAIECFARPTRVRRAARPHGDGLPGALADPDAAQRELLRGIVADHAATEFGRSHRFAQLSDEADYRAAVPLAGYDAFAPAIARMLEGQPDVLLPGRASYFGRTSGTSGEPKHVGYSAATEGEYRAAIEPMLDALDRDHPGASECALLVTGRYLEDRSPAGVPIGQASAFVRNLPAFSSEPYFHIAPEPVFEMTDYEARYYALLRFALARPVRVLSSLNPSSLLTLFARAARYADALADDLARGTLAAGPPGIRALPPDVHAALAPSPRAADRLRASVRAHGRFVPGEMWPQLDVIQVWKGGGAAHYLGTLRQLCPGCAVRAAVSGSTEGLLLVPLGDDWIGGVPALCSTYLEWFAEDDDPAAATIVPTSQLQEGRGYRVALTNRRGLYRYLMDDVFLLEGRVSATPVLRFSHRFGHTSSLTGEKLSEPQVIAAIEHATARTGVTLADYQILPEWGEPPHYVLVVELAGEVERARLARLVGEFEHELARINGEYASKRESTRLGPPKLLVLAPGEFDAMRKAVAEKRQGADAQLKFPRLSRDLCNPNRWRILQMTFSDSV